MLLENAKVFGTREIKEATEHAATGAVAVHLHCIVFGNSPPCFRHAVKRGEFIAHVVHPDKELLTRLARKYGVKVVYIDREGEAFQHVDLCGQPLLRLLTALGAADRFRVPVRASS